MNILITGATSQIGLFLLPLLVNINKYNIYALSRKKQNNINGITWIENSISDIDSKYLKTLNINIIIHLAEITLIDQLINKIDNISRIIAFSSTSAITKKDSKNIEDKRLAMDLLNGENNFIKSCSKYNINWTIFRPTLIYGANLDENITFISDFINKYHFFPILGAGLGLRQPVHSIDLANACTQVIENKKTYQKIYSLTGKETLTYSNMVSKIFKSLNKKEIKIKIPKFIFIIVVKIIKILPKFQYLTTGMIDRLNKDLCFDIEEAKKDFGYNPYIFLPNKDLLNDL
jgi:nucleoside-diphosphate-sugar epimerase